ncbi:hypothetical protein E4T44_07614 [Aureobasidium sp. EXF-8845]|nr:hypothetical protein E4T44_07614 [Aureobasidium sp. EXF-8845]KAI4850727.1 hypothetical protein E4T45_05374 [Aureobasidium sp. EXF-8846]
MAGETVPKRRPWHRKNAATKHAMANPSVSKKNTKLIIPDNLSSTNACVLEPLYGDETQVESESEQVVVRSDNITKQNWKWHPYLPKFPLVDLFRDFSQISITSKPVKHVKHKQNAATLIPGILRLPVEIRNQIYGYIFHPRLKFIKQWDDWEYDVQNESVLHDALSEYHRFEYKRPKAIKSLRIVDRTIDPISRSLLNVSRAMYGGSYGSVPGQKPKPIEGVDWYLALNSLLFACKTFYYEAGPILYGTTAFYFKDAQRLRGFLKTVSDRNLACITKLHIHVLSYGIPDQAADVVWEQEHIQCWTAIFAKIAKKMVNLRVLRITLSVRNVTDGLKRAFRPIKYNTDWKGRAGYMLMLRPLSDLTKLEDLTVKIRASDNIMQQHDEMLPLMIYRYWELANIHPARDLTVKVKNLHRRIFNDMHVGLEKAMKDVARGKDVDKSFRSVALVTRYYMDYMMDPIGNMLANDYLGMNQD